jgi:glycosyltransferase involved in cell wall biosynthesis
MKNKLVIGPIHYVLDATSSGSEFYWSYKIYEGIREQVGSDPIFIAGGTRGVTDEAVIDCKIFDPKKLDLSLKNIYRFYIAVYNQIKHIRDQQGGNFILHHVLPFSIGNSFNIFALTSKSKFVLGPIQSSLTVKDNDLDPSNARGFEKKSASLFTVFTHLILLVIKPLMSQLSISTLRKAVRIIAINENTREMIIGLGVKKDRIVIIPPGVDLNRFTPIHEKKKIGFEIVSVGYLLKRKGVDILLKAMSVVLKSNQDVILRIVGDGPQYSNLTKSAKDLGISGNVIFQGNVPNIEIEKSYRNSRVFVSMSRSESWGQMYLEAMASGLPIISSINDGSQSIIEDGVTGFLVDQEDFQAMANKIIYFSRNKDKIVEMGNNARRRVEEKFDWDKVIIPKYLKIYNSIA